MLSRRAAAWCFLPTAAGSAGGPQPRRGAQKHDQVQTCHEWGPGCAARSEGGWPRARPSHRGWQSWASQPPGRAGAGGQLLPAICRHCCPDSRGPGRPGRCTTRCLSGPGPGPVGGFRLGGVILSASVKKEAGEPLENKRDKSTATKRNAFPSFASCFRQTDSKVI